MSQLHHSVVREEEIFVAEALIRNFGGPRRASFEDGNDPPDLILSLGDLRVGVEVTRLSQRTLRPDGTQGNRASDDSFGMKLVDDLDLALGPLLPADVDAFLHFEMPVKNGAKFKSKLAAWMHKLVAEAKLGVEGESDIEGVRTRVKFIPRRNFQNRIIGMVGNTNSSPDIGLNAVLVLEDRIRSKNDKCKGLPGPLWLALLNDYWLADADSYKLAFAKVTVEHCFRRILLVTSNGNVTELHAET